MYSLWLSLALEERLSTGHEARSRSSSIGILGRASRPPLRVRIRVGGKTPLFTIVVRSLSSSPLAGLNVSLRGYAAALYVVAAVIPSVRVTPQSHELPVRALLFRRSPSVVFRRRDSRRVR